MLQTSRILHDAIKTDIWRSHLVNQAPPSPKFSDHLTWTSTQFLKSLRSILSLEAGYWLEESCCRQGLICKCFFLMMIYMNIVLVFLKKNVGQSGGIPGLDLNVEDAWAQGFTGKGITTAIMDDGKNRPIHTLQIWIELFLVNSNVKRKNIPFLYATKYLDVMKWNSFGFNLFLQCLGIKIRYRNGMTELHTPKPRLMWLVY